MPIGEIYFYLKELNKIPLPLKHTNIENLRIWGLDKEQKHDFIGLSDWEFSLKLKDKFTESYTEILSTYGDSFTNGFWPMLTKPNFSATGSDDYILAPSNVEGKDLLEHVRVAPTTAFQKQLLVWFNSGQSRHALPDILKQEYILNTTQDLLLFYGIKVLHIFSYSWGGNSKLTEISPPTGRGDIFHENKSLLVVTDRHLSPLFKHLHTKVLYKQPNLKSLMKTINDTIASKPSLQMLLLVDTNYTEEEMTYIQKHLKFDIPFNQVSLQSGNDTENYFDYLARKFVGIKLS